LKEEIVHVLDRHVLRPHVDTKRVAGICVPQREKERFGLLLTRVGCVVGLPADVLDEVIVAEDADANVMPCVHVVMVPSVVRRYRGLGRALGLR